jgi:hypothetical protein
VLDRRAEIGHSLDLRVRILFTSRQVMPTGGKTAPRRAGR